jgi:hypothetical protein
MVFDFIFFSHFSERKCGRGHSQPGCFGRLLSFLRGAGLDAASGREQGAQGMVRLHDATELLLQEYFY